MTAELICKYTFCFVVVYLLYFQTDFLDKINKKLDFIIEKINKQDESLERSKKYTKLDCCKTVNNVKPKRKKHGKRNKKKRNKSK